MFEDASSSDLVDLPVYSIVDFSTKRAFTILQDHDLIISALKDIVTKNDIFGRTFFHYFPLFFRGSFADLFLFETEPRADFFKIVELKGSFSFGWFVHPIINSSVLSKPNRIEDEIILAQLKVG